jgi:hypothetical protein
VYPLQYPFCSSAPCSTPTNLTLSVSTCVAVTRRTGGNGATVLALFSQCYMLWGQGGSL